MRGRMGGGFREKKALVMLLVSTVVVEFAGSLYALGRTQRQRVHGKVQNSPSMRVCAYLLPSRGFFKQKEEEVVGNRRYRADSGEREKGEA